MQISVIIATKNEEKNIKRLLESLKKQTFTDFEVIIVDNFSTDATVKIASKFTKKVFQAGPERSSQRNFGAKAAIGNYVLFLDADMVPQPNILKQCYQLAENNKHLAGILIDEKSYGNNFLAKVKALEKEIYYGSEEIEAARFVRTADFKKIGGFDESLVSGEDWDLSQRMRKFGPFGKISAKIYHYEENSFVSDLAKKFYYAKNIKKYASKHPSYFKKQAGFDRFLVLFSKPKLILTHPFEFVGLILLKFSQYLAYILSKLNPRVLD